MISPDGRQVVARGPEKEVFSLVPVEGGEPRPLTGMEKGDWPIQWSADGQTLYIVRWG